MIKNFIEFDETKIERERGKENAIKRNIYSNYFEILKKISTFFTLTHSKRYNALQTLAV